MRWRLPQFVAVLMVLAVLTVVLAPSTNLDKTALRGKTFAKMVLDQIALALLLVVTYIVSGLGIVARRRREWHCAAPAGATLLELNCIRRC